MKELLKNIFVIVLVAFGLQSAYAQDASSIRGKITSASEGALIGVPVSEIDATNRIVTTQVTDVNGNFSMKIKNPANRLKIQYIGYNTITVPIGAKRVFNVEMEEKAKIPEVVVKAKKKVTVGAMEISEKEMTMSAQTISSKEFEGLSTASVDDALQGKISGLDIVSNSGDIGSGTTMRIRGITSINGNSAPLIVLNGVVYSTPNTESFDFASANSEQFADLLSINVADIESITVLKDAASTAIYGAQGSNGVISIVTRRGFKGKTKVNYTYKYSGAVQPQGMKMLTGDDYTMLMKEAYFNPTQDDKAADIREFNYDPTYSEYENYNNNTDWIKAVKSYGETHDHSIQISGGGERAKFIISGSYYNQTGTVIGQLLNRYSTRSSLDYAVSDRIRFISEFGFSYSDSKTNGGILGDAYRKMPNLSIYAQDANGNDTDRFYKILPSISRQLNDQLLIQNPVARAYLSTNKSKDIRINPVFRLNYDLLDPEKSRLLYKGVVSFDVANNANSSFSPKELSIGAWDSGLNSVGSSSSRSLFFSVDNSITFTPKFTNSDHSMSMYGQWYFSTYNSRSQSISANNGPTGTITNPTAGAFVSGVSTGPGQSRSMRFTLWGHYAYKEKYVADLSLTRYGDSSFGDQRKWGTFPGVSFGWNVADEEFMKPTRSWLSTLKIRPSWGITGNTPGGLSYYSLYEDYSTYLGIKTIRPRNIQLGNLRWEKKTAFNWGFDFGIKDDDFKAYLDLYYTRTDDMIFPFLSIPSSSGFTFLDFQNVGSMDNTGWDVNLEANKLVKAGDFTMSMTLNFNNNVNRILALRPDVLVNYNPKYNYARGAYLSRVQINNAFGSIYGFKYKGVYQYNEYTDPTVGTSPFAFDDQGNVIRDGYGEPIRMSFAADQASINYKFKGGDAIYEDVNHDGNINELDIVYLGNSNPLFNGGLTLRFNYKRLSLNIFSTYRVGSKLINAGRMNAENMFGNDNQCASVNWRWRKEGDVTSMPRALFQSGYNWLGSDRYVEDGSFFRGKYMQVSYSLSPKVLKPLKLSQLSLYGTFNNLFVLTKYSGTDPEYGPDRTGVVYDRSQTPRSISFTGGVTVGF